MKTIAYILGGLWLYFFSAEPALALVLPKITIEANGNQETISIAVPAAEPYKVFTIENPDRLVVDIPQIVLDPEQRQGIKLPSSYNGKLIKTLRFGQFNTEISRFVFDLNQTVRITNITTRENKNNYVRLMIDIEEVKRDKKTAAIKKPSKPIIIIDPGHGGIDPGTIAADGTQEKDVVLEYARALQNKLLKSGKYDVVLTRDDDRFIMLRKRIEIARKESGNLFISLHADSAPDDVRGLSVYTLSDKASDEEAEALAARENKADVLAGIDLSDERKDVADILISLAQRETNNRAATLADFLVASLQGKVRLLPKSHRFAGFAVLKAPDIPSVLIELGFLSHKGDQKLIKTPSYREKVINGIAAGVDAYFKHKKRTDGE